MSSLGRVVDFDDARGDGHFAFDDGTVLYFHCVSIADASRTISPGTRATAVRRTGLQGHDEAVDIRPIS
jgi:hypothetical protein